MNKWTIVLLIAAVTMVVVEGATIKSQHQQKSNLLHYKNSIDYKDFEVINAPSLSVESNEFISKERIIKDLKPDEAEEMSEDF